MTFFFSLHLDFGTKINFEHLLKVMTFLVFTKFFALKTVVIPNGNSVNLKKTMICCTSIKFGQGWIVPHRLIQQCTLTTKLKKKGAFI